MDADHVSAINNFARKLMQQGKRPVAVGFMFSLGHSTVVVAVSIFIATTALALQDRSDSAGISAESSARWRPLCSYFAIAIVSLIVLRSIYRAFQRIRRRKPYIKEDSDLLLGNRGFLSRLFRPVFAMIQRSWHMYLFGLGFDTAREIGLLGISAVEASKGLSSWSFLVFPTLFAAGMSLIDTTDNILMLGAYVLVIRMGTEDQ